ncbi:MAG: hypothetical protein MMC23_003387 [Stictis urceolatum]|nr:hypothetical protein [Stictis urceolata]
MVSTSRTPGVSYAQIAAKKVKEEEKTKKESDEHKAGGERTKIVVRGKRKVNGEKDGKKQEESGKKRRTEPVAIVSIMGLLQLGSGITDARKVPRYLGGPGVP